MGKASETRHPKGKLKNISYQSTIKKCPHLKMKDVIKEFITKDVVKEAGN
jgi:hypothetical protein